MVLHKIIEKAYSLEQFVLDDFRIASSLIYLHKLKILLRSSV